MRISLKSVCAGLGLLAFAGGAAAQDPVGNLTAGLDHLAVNLNTTVNSLLAGEATQTVVNADTLASTLMTDLAADTPLQSLTASGIALSGTIKDVALSATPAFDEFGKPLADAALPVTGPVVDLTDQLLGGGLPSPGDGGLGLPLGQLPLDGLDVAALESLLSGAPLPGL